MSSAKPMTRDAEARRDAREEAQIVDRGAPPESRRRAHARYAVDMDVTVGSEHNFYAGFVENLSAGGVFVATHTPKDIGELVELSICLPETDVVIIATGEVCWIREYSESSDAHPGMGIKFKQLDPAFEGAISEFLSRREPLFFDDE